MSDEESPQPPIKKQKSANSLLEEYMTGITAKCMKGVLQQTGGAKKRPKVADKASIPLPTIQSYSSLTEQNFNVDQLKWLAANYRLKVSGNKTQLFSRVYTYLYLSSFIVKLQKLARGHLVRKYRALHGPAALNRKLCNNTEDFVTMEPLEDIKYHQFYSYTDTDGFIYGFDLASMYSLYSSGKSSSQFQNPYNRKQIPDQVVKELRAIARLGHILHIPIKLNFKEEAAQLSQQKAFELGTVSVFQTIDALGNYTNPQWFLNLSLAQLRKFVRELSDIWNFRANLSHGARCAICPPRGIIFRGVDMHVLYQGDLQPVQLEVLKVLKLLVTSAHQRDNQWLGATYVLGALTLVSDEAANALPIIYQSFSYL